MISALPSESLASLIADAAGLEIASVRVHIGLAAYFLVLFAQGTRRGSWIAFSAAVLASLILTDWCEEGPDSLSVKPVLISLWQTCLWPSVAVAASKFRRWRWNRLNGANADAAERLGPVVMGAR